MDNRSPNATSHDDLSALAWVQEELRKSLDAAHKGLRRALKDAEAASGSDVDAVEAAPLRQARTQLHQAAGVLELVGLPAGAAVLQAAEAAVQRYVAKPHKLDAAAVDSVEHGSFAVLDFVARRLAGRQVSPVALFPQYRALQVLAGAERVHPADLWTIDWQWHRLPAQTAAPRAVDAAVTTEFESQVLALMRGGGPKVARQLADLCAGLAAGAEATDVATLWSLGAAFHEALALDLLQPDIYGKRVTASLLAQLRTLQRGDSAVSERLGQDLAFFCAMARPAAAADAPHLAAARSAYQLDDAGLPARYDEPALGRFDPTSVSQAVKRVAGAKDGWSAVAGGEMHRLSGLNEQFSLVADSIKRLLPSGEALADALSQSAALTVQQKAAPAPTLAMECATSLLWLEAMLEDGSFDAPEQAPRVRRLAERIDAVRGGAQPQPLETWMEELYRRVADRQTMGSVVQELRGSLSESEKLIDQFFRAPDDPQVLMPVPAQLQAMRGVLSVLGLDPATHAVLRMRDDVDALIAAGPAARDAHAVFDRLAGNLSALSFMIDLIGVQPQAAKSLFAFDAASGQLRSLVGQRRQPVAAAAVADAPAIEQAQRLADAAVRSDAPLADISRELDRLAAEASPALAATLSEAQSALADAAETTPNLAGEWAVREQVGEALADFVATASGPIGLDELPAASSAPVPLMSLAPMPPLSPPTPAPQATGLEGDDEMREIFLEEAREVIEGARAALAALAADPADSEAMVTVRRAFHTLKGSSRMVGLTEFGEGAWACEQLFNTWLAGQQPASAELLRHADEAMAWFEPAVDEIAAGRNDASSSLALRRAADALRIDGIYIPVAASVAASAPEAVSAPVPLAIETLLPPASELEFAPTPVVEAPAVAAAAPLAFDFNLSAVAPEPAAPVAPSAEPLPEFTLDLAAFEAPFEVAAAPAEAVPAEPIVLDSLAAFDSLELAVTDDASAPAAELPSLDEVVAEASRDEHALTEPLALDSVAAVLDETVIKTIELDLPAPPAPGVGTEFSDTAFDAEDQGFARTDAGALAAAAAVSRPIALDIAPATAANDEPEPDLDQVKVIGELRISIQLFNIYLNEADELSRRLATELSEWALELHRPVGETAVALAHSLAGSSATVGFADLSGLARQLEHALMRSQSLRRGTKADAALFAEAGDEIRRLLHQFAAGFLKSPPPELLEALVAFEHAASARLQSEGSHDSADLESALESAVADAEDGIDAGFAAEVAHVEEPVVEPAVVIEPVEAASENAAIVTIPAELADEIAAPVAAEAAPALDAGVTVDAVAEEVPVADVLPATETALMAFEVGSAFADLGQAEFKTLAPLAAEPARAVATVGFDDDEDIDAEDAVDPDLFPIFEEEALELLPVLAGQLRDWSQRPADDGPANGAMRTLHTFKGGARLAGAMRVGELAHRLESSVERLLARDDRGAHEVETLLARADALSTAFEAVRQRDAAAYEAANREASAHQGFVDAAISAPMPLQAEFHTSLPAPLDGPVLLPAFEPLPSLALPTEAVAASGSSLPDGPAAARGSAVDWSRFARADGSVAPRSVSGLVGAALRTMSSAAVRVRAALLDRLVNQAGEVSITRARLETDVTQMRSALNDLTDNLERLRGQLRDIELQAETQMGSRIEAAKMAAQQFDPLEFDRYTRFQELTRMMAESVNDVATVQRSLLRTLESAEDELAAQGRLTRDLQDDLLRTRMVEFEGLSDRLYRVVRQAAKETGKQVRLDIVGGAIEVDRGVLDRMTGSFEHLLRNSVTHGIESPQQRVAAGKEAIGEVVVALHQEGNEVAIEFRDDGAGLDFERIRAKGVALGLLPADSQAGEAELANLIFAAGFSTAESVTELAGRGVGMDVVKNDVNALGGRIETASAPGRGTSFKLVLPLTTAVTQVVMLRCGEQTVAVPATLIEIVRRATAVEVEASYRSGAYVWADQSLPFFWLGALLSSSARGVEMGGRSLPVVVIRSAQQRIALHVDEVLGSQEVVVKNLGPQLSRLPGLAGMTLLASGSVALIYNPVALATVYGEGARSATLAALHHAQHGTQAQREAASVINTAPVVPQAPLILVVDDSLTVRRVTQRLLQREGYRVALAKDGLDGLERLAEERPAVLLSDIEMPRMDGFDLVRNVRGDAKLRDLPVIMITSRIAQKHRDYAVELGVNHYLGKPYSEEELLGLIAQYCATVDVV
ncbi:Hpt domain-containing protein [Rivibacter subsaxonicus]|uniref:Chemotaxis protein CheA n=1 Tax=Rivibacter subsaxonicus TaxID=457575 RepID=A0A4Q7VGM8_9BURK|nr:Hpt domain-containing protein [Rivibacter subsaxonicus]RZT95189.1 chemosensory pili system protein ChpA (sensor histidine kinase/response regulator) [Rivibacter subsaxonicus]